MAFKTTGEFYSVSFQQTNHASWGALGSVPSIPAALAQLIVDGTTFVVYVIDASTGTFAFPGGSATGFDDSVLAASSAALSKCTTAAVDGWSFINALAGDGSWWVYDPSSDVIHEMPVGEQTELAAFL